MSCFYIELLSTCVVENEKWFWFQGLNCVKFCRIIGNLDLKLDFVPPTLINFISRQLIGSGFRLYQKVECSFQIYFVFINQYYFVSIFWGLIPIRWGNHHYVLNSVRNISFIIFFIVMVIVFNTI